ncbi:SDR family NAD(P)-dependent oxidoreductase [Propionicimonas sp.]|uniref:SDR family NAD(P)-dependent oxidoreductase n=1 Tax=Propionicimonas sp. TaxID=1955623 RepID=UPI0017B29CCF|nr:SDR family NAD(P)-dependent oxidoreductase [Propionicimonas sp.]MBU3977921.1 SDR family NAD(P)-dependent oxidoreductase [Actinomycetota bacterium]MBA3021856.1 SDR family oxidoreductase [Propionicimonas sp.]MBU3985365.1 SDR family NAD(P)-dependent oxidoreductase [Actinomycetota bacterium]MBU4007420.1 SDR family NAD(P)-dependent oxidoreductase [Actinomycetota bacterium]MBU4065634.1 SDR family NAD(P)-dependent oxidoreductase [Actinomycetota bacterium]
MTEPVSGRLVLIAGATSASGRAAAQALIAAGAQVLAVGHDRGKLDARTALGAEVEACDLTDEGAVFALARRVHDRAGRVDGVLHLVGGWRGGGGLSGQSEADFRFLERSLTALRHVSRAFDADLHASASARTAMISSPAVVRPLAGGANYAAVKAAGEAWMHAVSQGLAKAARDSGEPLRAAAVVFRVATLAGSESVLASAFVDLWAQEPTDLNDQVIEL